MRKGDEKKGWRYREGEEKMSKKEDKGKCRRIKETQRL